MKHCLDQNQCIKKSEPSIVVDVLQSIKEMIDRIAGEKYQIRHFFCRHTAK